MSTLRFAMCSSTANVDETKPLMRRLSRTSFTDSSAAPIKQDDDDESTAWTREIRLLLELAIPTILIQLGFTVPSFLTASHVGRTFGPIYLDAFSLANLLVNLLTLSLLSGLYSASDTLSPQAFGARNYRQVGLLAMRGFFGGMLLIVPITVLVITYMQSTLIAIGEDPVVTVHAWRWYVVYVLSLPFYALYMVTWKFLAAQHVMLPLVVSGVVSCVVVLPLALKYATEWFGFLGSAVAICVFQMAQALLTLLYVHLFQPHHVDTWPTLAAWREALHWESLSAYVSLGVGGMVATSEWIYWEIVSLAIGTLGVNELSIHTVATQAILITFMVPLGIGIALSLRLGATISCNVQHAKRLTALVYVSGSVLFAFMSVIMYYYREAIFRMFTSDLDVIDGCHAIWWRVCFYFFHLGIYALNMGVSTGLGMQWTLGVVTFVFLWIFGLPAALCLGITKYHSLEVVWDYIWPPYMLANIVLFGIFVSKDWTAISKEVRRREGMERTEGVEGNDVEALLYGAVMAEKGDAL
ncbi:hypothetical protein MPSEU_000841700 [Mayamaea pseudoterrestris]|nr:hypothetical protein MPSEU_000841700 [Mayamaea pseudoterrestris]